MGVTVYSNLHSPHMKSILEILAGAVNWIIKKLNDEVIFFDNPKLQNILVTRKRYYLK
jgi:hypothetical protein